MSGPSVGRALRERFDAIQRAEVLRLQRKLRRLNDDDRRVAEAAIAAVVSALVTQAAATVETCDARTLKAVVRLFGLNVAA